MRYAIISDIHSNIEAFEAAMEDIERAGVDRILFLGDIIGYGPNPNECMDLLLKTADLCLAGNHDWALVGLTDTSYFNPFAKAALDWTGEVLRPDLKDFLARQRPADLFATFQVAHSSPKEPEKWKYILSHKDAIENYPFLERDLCFIGHSHQPIIIEYLAPDQVRALRGNFMTLEPNRKYIVNVGSIGQPRDGIPDGRWVIYDAEVNSIEFRRVPYDVAATQRKMEAAGLPRYLIERLAAGR